MTEISKPSIFWHDYETWGANPQKDHPSQFAGIRTDMELNIIDKPKMFYCQIPNDYLPHPQACLITGITPQQSLRDGMIEADFMEKIHHEFSQPNTCVAGYNSIRFDDEVTRYSFYRNFYEPYSREWQHGNSRWDIIDLVRACYALRPEGIVWPEKEDGSPSFRLEELTQANGISHQDAHDAMSDVYATIELAKLVKTKQPRLFDHLFNLRSKKQVVSQIDCFNRTPLVHVSSRFPAIHGCCSWIAPIGYHPTNRNAVIILNLAVDPSPLFDLSPEQIKEKMYLPNRMLAEGEARLPIKLLHVNKCPVVAPAKTLSEENAERLGIDRQKCLENLKKIKEYPGLESKLSAVFELERTEDIKHDPDHALYSGGFFNDSDRNKMEQIRQLPPEQLDRDWQFQDPRLNTLLFRYRARNYPSTLNEDQLQQWQHHRQQRLIDPNPICSISLPQYMQELELLAESNQQDANKLAIIKALYQYGQQI